MDFIPPGVFSLPEGKNRAELLPTWRLDFRGVHTQQRPNLPDTLKHTRAVSSGRDIRQASVAD